MPRSVQGRSLPMFVHALVAPRAPAPAPARPADRPGAR